MENQGLYNFLHQFLNDRRSRMIEEKVQYRTRYFTVLLEDIYQPKNISAVLRSAECLGVQDIHIIENKNRFEYNPYVTRGADKWLTVTRYNSEKNNSYNAVKQLKNKGYRIVATSPNIQGSSPDNFQIEKGKFAIALGTEWEGLSDIILNEADEHLKIPMVGYTESLNLSVSAAIIIYTLCHRLRNSGLPWQLNPTDCEEVKLQWAKAMVPRSKILIENFGK